MRRRMPALLGVAAAMLTVAGCGRCISTGCVGVARMEADAEDERADAPAFYKEFTREGRMYVIGTEAAAASFEKTHRLPGSRTLADAGPDGETVVLQADAERPELARRLEAEFFTRHPFYIEAESEGRIFVMGRRATYEAFQKTSHLPEAKTFAGADPEGKTVLVEVDKEDPTLVTRLVKRFDEKHGTKLSR